MLPAVAKKAAVAGRVGGVAAGLGVGIAALIALAAPASAAPDDTRGHSGTAPGRAAQATSAHRPAAPAAAARTTRTASALRIAAPAAAPRTLPALRTLRASRQDTSRSATAVSVAQPADPVSAVTDFVSSLFSCDPRGRLITIYKGTHFAIPNSFGLFTQSVTGTGTFTADTAYDLGDADQYDWNKFTGIAFTPLEPDRDSVMVGWRYNLTTSEFEIAPFYNVDKKRILPNEKTEVISVPAGQAFSFAVDYNGVTLSYGGKTVYKPFPSGLTANVWTAARVSGWFGGNEVAPRTVSYYLNIA